ncbi:MAG TPA: hypothetical protein PL045_11485 [Chitinophagaceae bacterium]|nr:hypothetical protein [Chitinophagaceae bacterium]
MCNTCRQNNIAPEFESALHGEYHNELYPELEWGSYFQKAKSYASPLFNWLKGSSLSSAAATQTTEAQLVQNAIAGGNTNENVLTDLIFYKRHPELGGKPLSSSTPNAAGLAQEWVSIRDGVVRPALKTGITSLITPTGTGYSSSGGTGKITLQNILNAMKRKSYVVYTNPYQLNIVGVRANNATPNSFDDTINVFYKDNTGNWQFKSNPATTDPGTYWLNNPSKVSGTAIVLPGQYINSHKIGYHHASDPVKRYMALVQQGPMKITRDYNKDNKLDFRTGRVETATSTLNIHRATKSGTSKTVNEYSAGCQVFANSDDFKVFMQLCQQHSNLFGNNFTYTLLEEGDLL